MVTPHCVVSGHVGSCAGWEFVESKIDEVLEWTEGFGDRGSAGSPRILGNEDESTTAKIKVSIMFLCNLRKISRCRSKTLLFVCMQKGRLPRRQGYMRISHERIFPHAATQLGGASCRPSNASPLKHVFERTLG